MLLKDIFGSSGKLAKKFAGFELREGQRLMAEGVSDVLAQGTDGGDSSCPAVLLVEAETGIGKTLAYLVPAILSGQRVVVSTATINLQDQIMDREIPLLGKVLDREIPSLCIKGRQNYLCHYRWFQYRSTPGMSDDDGDADRIEKWLCTTESGDRSELSWLPDRSRLWPKISSHSSQCMGSDCPEFSLCFVNRLRKSAGSARLLVVNHHLFFSDLALKQGGFGEILPRYQAVIFDEAHHLEDVASAFFGKQFSHYQMLDLIHDLERALASEDLPPGSEKIAGNCRSLKQRLDVFSALFPVQKGRYPLLPLIEKSREWQPAVDSMATGLEKLADHCSKMAERAEIWNFFVDRALVLRTNLLDIGRMDTDGDNRFVRWYEKRERTVAISATPVKVAQDLQTTLYRDVQSIVMTSATMTTGDDFKYIRERLGVPESAKTLRFNSPFDYRGRTLLYVPGSGFPEPSQPNYSELLCEQLYEVLTLSRGRGLVLFTSFRSMDIAADYLVNRLPYLVLVQGTASRQALLDQFRADMHSVLLAVASFWEGVDVSGESLSCVLIDKLPFEVPSDPVIQARMKGIEEDGGRPFFKFQVPRAILSLRQGVGRLMRSSVDRGVIGIMDVRLFSKGYGKMFRNSLPPSPVVRSMADLELFFREEN